MTRPLLYVCAPFRTRTLDEARATHDAIALALRLGWAPIFGPLLLRDFLSDANEDERAMAIECDTTILAACTAFLVVGERVTEGMRHEMKAWQAISRKFERSRALRAHVCHLIVPGLLYPANLTSTTAATKAARHA